MSPAQTHQKAKSRLTRTETDTNLNEVTENKSFLFAPAQTPPQEKRSNFRTSPDFKTSVIAVFWSSRLRFLILLFLGLLGYAVCVYIFRMVHPNSIANILFYNSYIPLLIIFFLSNFFFFSFLFLHSRRAFLLSLALTVLLFFKLQSVVLTGSVIGIVFGVTVFIELISFFIFRK